MPEASPARPYIGGQAVLEGVMMRAPRSFAVVVRRRDGSLHVRERPIHDERKGAGRWPFVRGVMSLVESLKLGSEALRFSAEQMEKDLEQEEAEAARAKAKKGTGITSILSMLGVWLTALVTAADGEPVQSSGEKKGKGPLGFMLVVAIVFLIALPQMAAAGVNDVF